MSLAADSHRETARWSGRSRRGHCGFACLTARIETGEPYLVFSDHVNRARPEHHKLAGLEVETSNLCSEITLPDRTRPARGGTHRSVLSRVAESLESWFEWQEQPTFIADVMRFLDNVCNSSIAHRPEWTRRVMRRCGKRSVGLGVMGFHYCSCSRRMFRLESAIAKVWNKRHIPPYLARRRIKRRVCWLKEGPCPDAQRVGGRWSGFPISCRLRRPPHFDHRREYLARNRADRGERVFAEDTVGEIYRAQQASAEATGGGGDGQ